MFIAYHYNNYIQRGYSRFSWLTFVGVLFADISLIFGTQNIYIIAPVILVSLLVFFDLVGKFDYSNRGTRIPETKKYWESDFGIAAWVMLFGIMKKIATKYGVELTQEEKEMGEWLERIYKKNKFAELVKEDLDEK
jgi:hypothetical protein